MHHEIRSRDGQNNIKKPMKFNQLLTWQAMYYKVNEPQFWLACPVEKNQRCLHNFTWQIQQLFGNIPIYIRGVENATTIFLHIIIIWAKTKLIINEQILPSIVTV